MHINISKLCSLIEDIILETDWKINNKSYASTGSVYYELVRDNREFVVVRVSDHAQYYQKYLKTYSIDPTFSGISLEELGQILNKPFGAVGDVLL